MGRERERESQTSTIGSSVSYQMVSSVATYPFATALTWLTWVSLSHTEWLDFHTCSPPVQRVEDARRWTFTQRYPEIPRASNKNQWVKRSTGTLGGCHWRSAWIIPGSQGSRCCPRHIWCRRLLWSGMLGCRVFFEVSIYIWNVSICVNTWQRYVRSYDTW